MEHTSEMIPVCMVGSNDFILFIYLFIFGGEERRGGKLDDLLDHQNLSFCSVSSG